MVYSLFKQTAIRAVRDLKEYNLVDPRYLTEDGQDTIYAPILNLCSLVKLEPQSLQQLIEEDTYKPFLEASLSGGAHVRVDAPNSFDSFINRDKIKEINVA